MSIVLPGDYIPAQHVNLKLGPGIQQLSTVTSGKAEVTVIATRAGQLHHSQNRSKWWIESNSRRYVPAAQESVIGVITQKIGEGYRVDIGSAHFASLDSLAFEGATKRNKPNLKVGCLVYARVSLAHKDMEPELECFDAQTRKSEGFGELKGGFIVRCSLKMCREYVARFPFKAIIVTRLASLLDPKHYLLPLVGSRFPLEAAVGMNGRIWVSAKEIKQTIALARCIEASDPDGGGLDEVGLKSFLDTLDV